MEMTLSSPIRIFITVVMAVLICGWSWDSSAAGADGLRRDVGVAANRVRALGVRRRVLMRAVSRAAHELSRLKAIARKGGLAGLSARVRLSGARARAQSASEKVQRLDRALRLAELAHRSLTRKLVVAVRARLITLSGRLSKTAPGAGRRTIRARLKALRIEVRRLRSGLRASKRGRGVPRVAIDPLDGPRKIMRKADRVKDQEDRLNSRLARLRRRIRSLRKRVKAVKRDRRLEREVEDHASTDGLFGESERNPRVAAGRAAAPARTAPKGATGVSSTTSTDRGGGSSTSQGKTGRETQETKPPTDNAASPKSGGSFGASGGSRPADGDPGAGAATGLAAPPSYGGSPGASEPSARTGSLPPRTLRTGVSHLPGRTLMADPRVALPRNPEAALKVLQGQERRLASDLGRLRGMHRKLAERARKLREKERARKARRRSP